MRRHTRIAPFLHPAGEVPPVNTTQPVLNIEAVIDESRNLQR